MDEFMDAAPVGICMIREAPRADNLHRGHRAQDARVLDSLPATSGASHRDDQNRSAQVGPWRGSLHVPASPSSCLSLFDRG